MFVCLYPNHVLHDFQHPVAESSQGYICAFECTTDNYQTTLLTYVSLVLLTDYCIQIHTKISFFSPPGSDSLQSGVKFQPRCFFLSEREIEMHGPTGMKFCTMVSSRPYFIIIIIYLPSSFICQQNHNIVHKVDTKIQLARHTRLIEHLQQPS